MKKTILVALLLAVSISCIAIGKKKRAILDSWLRHTKHELIVAWGPPDRRCEDGSDGEIIIYAKVQQTAGYYAFNTWQPGRTFYNYTMFYVNADGLIYSWRTSRETVPPQQIDITVYNR